MFPSSRNSESIISRNLNGLTVLIQARQRQSRGRTRPRRHRTLSLRPRRGLPLRDRAQPRPRTLLPHPRQYHSRLGRLIPCGGSPTPPARVLHPRAPIFFYNKNAPSVAGKAATLGAILYKSKGCGDVIPAGVQGQRSCPTFSALKSTVNSRIGCSLCRKRDINTVQC